MYSIKKLINLKYISKNIHYILLIFLIILIVISLYTYFYKKEHFIGKEKSKILSDLGDEVKIEKKEYEVFPPLKNKSKFDLLNNIFGKDENQDNQDNQDNDNNNINIDNKHSTKDIPISMPKIQDSGKNELEKSDLQKAFSSLSDKKPLLGSCDFYFNKCPSNKSSMATIKGNNLSCGNNQESKAAKAIAEIKNGHISKIIVLDGGNGYNYQNPPKITIDGNKGATAKANVDKNGIITSIDIIDYGYNYVETPNITIEPPQMDGVCHLCC